MSDVMMTTRPKSKIVTQEEADRLARDTRAHEIAKGCRWFHRWKYDGASRCCKKCGKLQYSTYS